MKMTYKSAFALMAGLAFSACSILPEPAPAPTVYRLYVPQSAQAAPVAQSIVVNIEYPNASKAIGGTDITLSPDGRRLTAAAGAKWSEAVPSMLRNALIEKLARNGGITGVVPRGNTRVPYRVNMDIRRFEAVFDNGEDAAPNAVVQLTISLTNTKTRTLIGTKSVSANARAGAASVSSIVAATDTAAQQAMDEASAWLAAQLSNSRS